MSFGITAPTVSALWSPEQGQRGPTGRSYERGFRVFINDDNATNIINAAIDAPGIPRQNVSTYPTDEGAICRFIRAKQIGPKAVEVFCTFVAEDGDPNEDPLLAPPEVSFDQIDVSARIDYDANNVPIVNTARESIDVDRTVADGAVIIVRNEPVGNWRFLRSFVNTVNEDPIGSWQPGQAFMRRITPDPIEDANPVYWRVTYRVEFREGIPEQPDGTGGPSRAWHARRANKGRREWIQTNIETGLPIYQPILDTAGNPISEPELLDENGGRLPAEDDPVFLEFAIYPSSPWAALNLPQIPGL